MNEYQFPIQMPKFGLGSILNVLPTCVEDTGEEESMYKEGEIVIGTQGNTKGCELKIEQINPNMWNNGIQATQYVCRKKTKVGKWGRIYFYLFSEQISPSTKEKKLEYAKKEKESLERAITEINKKIDFLENYEDEEDYVATKITEMVKNKSDKDAIREILKEMKRTKLL